MDHWKHGHKGECQVLSQTNAPKEFILPQVTEPKPTAKVYSKISFLYSASSLTDKITSKDVIKREQVPLNDFLFPPKRVQQMMTYRPENITVVCIRIRDSIGDRSEDLYWRFVLEIHVHTVAFDGHQKLQYGHGSPIQISNRIFPFA
jgi:hypothetical protein